MSAASILEKEAAVKKRHTKELIKYCLVSGLVLAAALSCVWTVISKGLASSDGKLAFSLLAIILSALLGYIAGKSAK